MNILILYTELAGYIKVSLEYFARQNPQFHIHLVVYPVNDEAPFDFQFSQAFTVYNRKQYTANQLIELEKAIQPQAILCSGWIDKGYLAVCSQSKAPIKTLVFDTLWAASLKQRALQILAPVFILSRFNRCWVPGQPQKQYALKLGFKDNQIYTGFYCGDTLTFESFQSHPPLNNNKKLLCVARYIPQKNLEFLWHCFLNSNLVLQNQGWELWCVGTGALFENRTLAHQIKHFGFIQPHDLKPFVQQCDYFVLPSLFEPWGVVVHEFAAAGMPLILSNQVGAASQFLIPTQNGFAFNPNKPQELIQIFNALPSIPPQTYQSMSQLSVQQAQSVSLKQWAQNALSLIMNQ